MKNIFWKDQQLDLLPVQNEQSSNRIEENAVNVNNQPDKIVIHDECGDTLWDDVLAQDKIKTVKDNG